MSAWAIPDGLPESDPQVIALKLASRKARDSQHARGGMRGRGREVFRFTLPGSSRPDGAVVYDDSPDQSCPGGTTVHVFNDTSPLRGSHSSFDFVRIAKFGHLDKDCPKDVAMADRPSYKAMCEFAEQQPEIRAARAEQEGFEDLTAWDQAMSIPAAPANVDPFEQPKPKRFQLIKAADFMRRPRMAMLVKGVLPRAELAILYGEPGAGKSPIAWSLARALNSGASDWHGLKIPRQARAVYVVCEGANGFRNRIEADAKDSGTPLEQMPDLIDAAALNLKDPRDAQALGESIGKADFIAVDTLAAAFIGNESSGEDMGPVLNNCRLLHKITGALVMLITHPGKDLSKGVRGWSGQRGAADTELEVTRQGDFRALAVTKAKDFSEGKLFDFRIKLHELGRDEDGDAITSVTIERCTDAPAVSSKLPKPGTLARAIYDKALQLNGALEQDLRAAVVADMSEPDPTGKDRRNSRVGEKLDELVRLGHLFRLPGKRISTTQVVQGGEDWAE